MAEAARETASKKPNLLGVIYSDIQGVFEWQGSTAWPKRVLPAARIGAKRGDNIQRGTALRRSMERANWERQKRIAKPNILH